MLQQPPDKSSFTLKGSLVFLGICILLGSCVIANKYSIEASNPSNSRLVEEQMLTNQKLDQLIELLSKNP
ncbi:hypothetical protein DVH26_15120 [Paenibacillus sp. H1-7]|uniref:hypothetical protein n=1 Tax=Paenibacillus sp. H1-7 TaxID=2282849 RepID=UPI001EF82542|nr:hypothetical protein [Paenibacillus sp. H1-7]ULL15659.1 hypothetical protein DVH26_15120 [Paenibacillus sp. H1-7]